MTEPVLKLEVDPWDLDELREALGEDFLGTETQKPDGSLGEPITIIVIALGFTALAGLSAWAQKDRRGQSLKRKYEKVSPDGTIEKSSLSFEAHESVSSAEVLKELAKIFPAEIVGQALAAQ